MPTRDGRSEKSRRWVAWFVRVVAALTPGSPAKTGGTGRQTPGTATFPMGTASGHAQKASSGAGAKGGVALAASVKAITSRVKQSTGKTLQSAGALSAGVAKGWRKWLVFGKDIRVWLWWVGVFLLARGTLLGGLAAAAPAALAVTAARRPGMLLWSVTATAAGWYSGRLAPEPSALSPDPLGLRPATQLTAWLAVAAVTAMVAKRRPPSVTLLAVITALTIWSVEGVAVAWLTPSLYSAVLVAFEGLFSSVAVVIVATAENTLESPAGRTWNRDEQACMVVVGLLLLLGLPQESFFGLSLTGTIAKFSVLLGAYALGPGAGAAVGVALGLLPSLAVFGAPSSLALLALSGLLAGLFRPWAKPGVIGGFLSGHLLLSIYMANSQDVRALMLEAAVAGLLLILWPSRWIQVLRQRLSSRKKELVLAEPAVPVSAKLDEMGRMIGQMAVTFEEIAEPAPATGDKPWEPILLTIAERVCKPCPSYGLCWERDAERTRQYLNEILQQVEERGQVTAKSLTPQLARRCARLAELSATIGCLLETVEVDRYWRRRLSEGRHLVSAHFRGLAGWMASLAQGVEQASPSEKKGARLAKALEERGFRLKTIKEQGENGQWRIFVEGKGCSGAWPCAEHAAAAAAEVLGQTFIVGKSDCRSGAPGRCLFSLIPVRPYGFDVGIAQAARHGSAVSGDSVGRWEAPASRMVVALSDGSGVGPRAARESSATLSLLEHLCRMGVHPGEALRSVNALVALATEEESFATVDMAMIDLASAEAEIFKLGASSSYLKRGRRVQVLRQSSLPLGILKNVEVESLSLAMLPGDRLILVSDGIVEATRPGANRGGKGHSSRGYGDKPAGEGDDWLISWLERDATADPQALADQILLEAIRLGGGKARDDCSVVVVALSGREERG
ncbi:SpoIIE family protein phosphatase [Heliomicrobium gestii]|uniref:SpoIIE family protein phosphatase n=1 Tax=Heliomicrobium gestii TaxID=2699 RepID=UPI00136C82AA|nr:SpoIIE family protein phosphatase [Heliomicrobium gestii]